MESSQHKILKELCKDEASFKKAERLFCEVEEERDRFKRDLNLLESAIENDYDSILITELELEEPGPRIVYVNDGFTKMTGYSKEEVFGKTPRILQGPKTDRDVLDKLKSRLKEGKSFFGQTVNYRKDGSEFVNQWDIHPLTDDEGNITHWVSYQHDITERKRAEQTFVEADTEFDDLRESSSRTVVDIDLQGNIAMANKSFRELIGYGKDELRQIKIWDLFPRKYRDSLRKRFDQENVQNAFGNDDFKGIIRHNSGVPIQIQGNTKTLDLKDQTLIRAEIRNISLQKKIMKALKDRNKTFERIFGKASEYTYLLELQNGEPVYKALSENFPEITGFSPQKLRQKGGYKELIHSEDIESVKSHYEQAYKGTSCTCCYRIRTSDEEYIEIIDYAKPKWDINNASVVGIKGAVSLKQ